MLEAPGKNVWMEIQWMMKRLHAPIPRCAFQSIAAAATDGLTLLVPFQSRAGFDERTQTI
ncbi:MAG: hypothetical protein CME89_04720 [Hirschia sp.]|nr:hypothetical protein [Hirschia sp.]